MGGIRALHDTTKHISMNAGNGIGRLHSLCCTFYKDV